MEYQVNYPKTIPDNPLAHMFELQKKLLSHYIGIEGLPQYPMSLEPRANQKLMKDFIDRAIEELSEAHEYYRELYTDVSNNRKNNLSNLVYNFNKEIGDVLHFFIEALIYANIGPADIVDWYQRIYSQHHLEIQDSKNPLEMGYLIASYHVQDNYNIKQRDLSFLAITDFMVMGEPLLASGRRVSMAMLRTQSEILWDITHQLKKATNCLKNNPWKQSDTDTDTSRFHEQMMNAWMALMNLLYYNDFTVDLIYTAYYHCNVINHQRIKQKR